MKQHQAQNIGGKNPLDPVQALPYGLKGFARFAEALGLKLYAYERTILKDYFAGCLETVCIIPKKNGKSTLLAALALYHIYKTPQARCFIGAASKEQASLIFWQSETLVNNAGLQDTFDVKGGYKHIRCGASLLRVLAGDARTADGTEPTLALVDELHRHRSGDLYDVLLNGLRGTGHGRMITISTAGASMDSPLGRLRDAAYELPGRISKGAYTYVRSEDFALHEWSLNDGDNTDDMKVVKRANPAPWITPVYLLKFYKSPSMTEGTWLRFACGIWTEGDEPPISPKLWDEARGVFDIPVGEKVWVGVALGQKLEQSAIVVVHEVDGSYFVQEEILPAPTYADLEERCVELSEAYDLQGLVYNSKGFQRSADLLEEQGLRIIEMLRTPQRMTEASATFVKLLQEGKLHHGGSKALRDHVMSARAKETGQGWQFHPDPLNPRPVAALFAILATLQVMVSEEPPPFMTVGWL